MENTFRELDGILTETGSKLNEAAFVIRELNFDTDNSLRKIGRALSQIYEIQEEIYKLNPELKPLYLKE